ncbi:acireductone synthase [Larsenimonas suaedae]|uniref:Enolase-phosphatase E1 n=1 Tax=Larsenimonas suaedae TaxID=1851019 RepID=A0ABU1GVT3_9GAMM|nr:acireductone synthase [Larsenimonas suaedae]MCM2971886.1 acireductone synthase [Larsenimonas suaedae]MDR5895438.1 acireductone synthase [Larsenimonas suaedae]
MIKAIVTDIEGTTSSIAFVHEVLFPYARERLPQWLEARAGQPAVAEQLDAVRAMTSEEDASVERLADVLVQWIDEDRKATPLKTLQGMIWEEGYREGDFKSHIYPDAAECLKAWHDQGLELSIYSSGSVHAQKLMFAHTELGDITPLITHYFDTTLGAKRDSDSYRRMLDVLAVPPEEVLFLSDVPAELDAAEDVGIRTCQLVRDPDMETGHHHCVHRFDEIDLDELA